MKHYFKVFATFAALIAVTAIGFSQQNSGTRLMSQPAISENHIAFIYAEDLWVANRDGSNPIRLTIDEGIESRPVFSPNGEKIAFNAQYDGNTDVYIVDTKGGIPKRLTWHPYSDFVNDFTPDGTKVLFGSQRSTHTNRFAQQFSISVNGGAVTKLPIPNAVMASYSDNGKFIAYTPNRDVFSQWKYYRGGTMGKIWLYNTANHEIEEIAKPAGGSNETSPQWMGDHVYFRSDRSGEFNLFSYNTNTKEIKQLTNYDDFPVLNLSASNGAVIYEQAGYLHEYNVDNGSSKVININITTDLLELRERYVSGSNYVRSASISPSGARIVVDFRGEIVTIPGEKGDTRNLSNSSGVHEKEPSWSPDGKKIAYFSDESGEYALHIQPSNGGLVSKIALNGTGFYSNIHWAPDNNKLAYVDNGRNLYITDLTNGKTTKIAQDTRYVPGAFRDLFGSWAFDSNWLSYTIITDTNFERAFAYSIKDNKSHALSDGLSNVSDPVFDPSGKYLYMLASTDAGPVINWFDQSNQDMEMSSSVYLVTLQKETISPLIKENDEEKDSSAKKDKKDTPETLVIDWDGIENRIIDLPMPASNYRNLKVANEGQLYFVSTKDGTATISKFDLSKRKSEAIMPAQGFDISADKKKMLYFNRGRLGITNTGSKPKGNSLNVNAVKVKINPVKEWNNIYNEMWRVNRDYFYDPSMHGIDWTAMKSKYAEFLPHLTCRSDLYRVMEWMCSEIGVGHHRFGSRGDRMNNPQRIVGGLLGADYTTKNNRYQISKIYGGLNWNPNMRSPLTEPGVNVEEGDYIIAVNGVTVNASQNIHRFFENTANTLVDLTVSKKADGSAARTVKVTPLSNESAIRNRDWVEGNIKKVDKATNGQVAYVYVPNTAGAGHQYFKRYFFPQATKKAVIIDERYNGGGQLADYYIDMLKKPEQAYWNFRYGKDLKSPSASIQGPKVMIVDENAGSGGDYLPWMFRKFNLGTIIGKTTWGGLVGVLGYPEFIDGGSVTAPNVAFYTDEGFKVENEGVAPDIEVEQLPKLINKGQDPQLDKAIEVILEQLKNYPERKITTPPYPDKSKN